MKEIKKNNVAFALTGTGHRTARINLSLKWLDDMQVSLTNREVIVEYDNEKKEIVIKKAGE